MTAENNGQKNSLCFADTAFSSSRSFSAPVQPLYGLQTRLNPLCARLAIGLWCVSGYTVARLVSKN